MSHILERKPLKRISTDFDCYGASHYVKSEGVLKIFFTPNFCKPADSCYAPLDFEEDLKRLGLQLL